LKPSKHLVVPLKKSKLDEEVFRNNKEYLEN
jgi:hypothetical protein